MEHNKKEIVVTGESQLQDIQAAFSHLYPFLIIEHSYDNGLCFPNTDTGPAWDKALRIPADTRTPFTIDVSSQRTVSEVMYDVTILFRVKLQICRKSGNVWNAVSVTENWTLERQNSAGEYISRIMAITPVD